ncbi:hypothetical protein HPB51_006905 [Rhipicephalus microplus]|uniref:Uncharacterized protein n=1 Tax=Rhipicephalus microplus TaxID=6941 RepID=A0A9J6D475_RHIMP|nr:hypothetical protein HPB51_006905 [Rhipicephalus microplus]
MSHKIQGSKEDFADGFISELCEDGPNLTPPHTWDKFASAIGMQETSETESEDVFLAASRRLRTAVDRVLRVNTGDICSLSFGGDVTTRWRPRSPAFDDYHMKEWLPPMHEWAGQPQLNRHMTMPYGLAGPALHQEHRCSVMCLPTMVLVDLS